MKLWTWLRAAVLAISLIVGVVPVAAFQSLEARCCAGKEPGMANACCCKEKCGCAITDQKPVGKGEAALAPPVQTFSVPSLAFILPEVAVHLAAPILGELNSRPQIRIRAPDDPRGPPSFE